MARFKYYDRYFAIMYLKMDKGLPYYRRKIPRDLIPQLGKKDIVIRLFKSNQSYEAQCRMLGDEHSVLFAKLKENPELYGPNRERIQALLAKHGTSVGMGILPIPAAENQYPEYGDTPHLDDFLLYIQHQVDSKRKTPTDTAALEALKNGFPALLSDAKRIYLDDPRQGKWRVSATAYWDKLIAFKGDLQLKNFSHKFAKEYRDQRLEQGAKTQTVMKEMNILRSGFNKAFLELNILTSNNPFKNLSPDKLGKDATKKPSLTHEQIKTILASPPSEHKAFALIQMLTGARISEVAGVRLQDVDEKNETITFIEYEDRTLKTNNSSRTTPLLDFALKAIRECPTDGVVLFPRYSDGKTTKGDNASANINHWLRSLLGPNITSHCFRHTMTTLLKNANVPEDLREEITGHSRQRTSANYGEASALKRKRKALERAFSFLKDEPKITRSA